MAKKSLLCKRLKEKRMKLGINQAELSRISGVKPPTICRIEKGITEEVNTDTLKALAIALDTSTDWLLGLT